MICFRNELNKRQFAVCFRKKWYRITFGGWFNGRIGIRKYKEGFSHDPTVFIPKSFPYKKLKLMVKKYINLYGV